jgi:hypothetical protein
MYWQILSVNRGEKIVQEPMLREYFLFEATADIPESYTRPIKMKPLNSPRQINVIKKATIKQRIVISTQKLQAACYNFFNLKTMVSCACSFPSICRLCQWFCAATNLLVRIYRVSPMPKTGWRMFAPHRFCLILPKQHLHWPAALQIH